MEETEKKMTPQESVEVMQRMVRQAQESAHFSGRPFLYSGLSFVIVFLLMALFYWLRPEGPWTWVLLVYFVLHGILWYRSLPEDKETAETLADRVIGEVWRTGLLILAMTMWTGNIMGKGEIVNLIPPIILLEMSTIAAISSFTNDDEYGGFFGNIGMCIALILIFGNKDLHLDWLLCLKYAAGFGIILLGIGWRWNYLAKHPEKRRTMQIDLDEDE